MVAEIIFRIDIFDLMWYQHVNEEGARFRETSGLVVLDSVRGGNPARTGRESIIRKTLPGSR
jgi:hypothetical protein